MSSKISLVFRSTGTYSEDCKISSGLSLKFSEYFLVEERKFSKCFYF